METEFWKAMRNVTWVIELEAKAARLSARSRLATIAHKPIHLCAANWRQEKLQLPALHLPQGHFILLFNISYKLRALYQGLGCSMALTQASYNVLFEEEDDFKQRKSLL